MDQFNLQPMRIARLRVRNFANFGEFEVATGENLVIVGENKVGKSNLLFALQLILDPSLSERDRQLGLEHFWDGLGDDKLGATIEISVDLTDFDEDHRLLAHLGDCLVDPGPPMVSRLTYRFQPKAGLDGDPTSLADYEYLVFGGTDPDTAVRSGLRRMLPLDVLGALRDAEKDLATWRRSPLRPLIEKLTAELDEADRDAVETAVNTAQAALTELDEVDAVARTISGRLEAMVGPAHATSVTLGLSPTRIDALLRALRLLIDDGARGVADASLGTANLIFLALKSLELDELVREGERDHTFLAVEEPEAHLHPQVQRLVYRHFLTEGETDADEEDEDEDRDGVEAGSRRLTTILTTHSPHIASVAPIRSIVLLRRDAASDQTVGVSTANAPLTPADEADLQRYIDVTRGELFFARGVILVEGDAERFLVPAFAEALDINFDKLGISVCSVAGTNFTPYVKLLGHSGLAIPHVILTDLDPVAEGSPPLARRRVINILEIVEPGPDYANLADAAIFRRSERHGVFINGGTLEPELFVAGMGRAMGRILRDELPLRPATRTVIDGWVNDPDTLDADRLVKLIERVGKGRFAQRLARRATATRCPAYIRAALERIRDAVA